MTQGKNKIIAIHQPNYLPWLGYFYKIYQSEVFVFLDDAQFSNKGMHNYTHIKTPQGPYRLKYPVIQSLGDPIYKVESRDELPWRKKHIKTVEVNYRKAPFFYEVIEDYTNVLNSSSQNIAEFNAALIKMFAMKLSIQTKFIFSSELNVNQSNEERIIELCKKLDGKIYYSGLGAKAYQSEQVFRSAGIELKYSEFKPFVYSQLHGDFQSNVSVLDYLMNCGYDWDRVIENQN
jgi:hypothetical protein